MKKVLTDSPIILTSKTTVPVNSKIELVTPDLQNQFNTPMLLDEIRMASTHQAIRLRLYLGRFQLTSDFVPICMFGAQLAPGQNPNGALPLYPEQDDTVMYTYTWKLPRPLFLASGEFLVPTLFNQGPSGIGTATARITYVGRSLGYQAQAPKVRHLPWVSFYDAIVPTSGSLLDIESSQADLYNPWDQPVKVQRLLGRFMYGAGSGGAVETINSTIPWRDAFIRITDSAGRFLVKDPTPFSHVFFINDRAWDINALWAPKAFYLASFSGETTPVSNAHFFVSTVGHWNQPYAA